MSSTYFVEITWEIEIRHRGKLGAALIQTVSNGIHISTLEHATSFDHDAVVTGIARSYAQRGLAVRSEPPVPGGRRADLAVELGGSWTYVEVKTRNASLAQHDASLRKNFLREMLRLRAHSLKQLPRKESALMVLSISASVNRKTASNRIAIARTFGDRFFDENSDNIIGMMILAPFRSERSRTGWRYASAMIMNPSWDGRMENFEELAAVQL